MQLFKFFHTENTSDFKTQTAKIGGFCEELLSENDFEAVLVNFCCYQYGTNASEAVQKVSRAVVGGILQFFSKPPTKTDAPHGVVPSLKNETPPPPPPPPSLPIWKTTSFCQFWNDKSIPLQILYPSSVSWTITPLYFLAQTIYNLLKRSPWKWKCLRLWSAQVKICQNPYANFETISRFLSKFYIPLQFHERYLPCNF